MRVRVCARMRACVCVQQTGNECKYSFKILGTYLVVNPSLCTPDYSRLHACPCARSGCTQARCSRALMQHACPRARSGCTHVRARAQAARMPARALRLHACQVRFLACALRLHASQCARSCCTHARALAQAAHIPSPRAQAARMQSAQAARMLVRFLLGCAQAARMPVRAFPCARMLHAYPCALSRAHTQAARIPSARLRALRLPACPCAPLLAR